MCTQKNADIVKEVVQEFVDKKWTFTAYTITTEAKNRGADERHGQMKGTVHDMFRNSEITGYTRSVANIPGLTTQPFLYTPDIQNEDEEPVVAMDNTDATNAKTDTDSPADDSEPDFVGDEPLPKSNIVV